MPADPVPPVSPSLRPERFEVGDETMFSRDGHLERLRFEAPDLTELSLERITLNECDLKAPALDGATLTGARFIECRIERLDAAVLRAARSTWRESLVQQSRVGSAELFDGAWERVEFLGCRLGYLNLRSARLSDVRFTDCSIDELDLTGARVERMAFENSTLSTLTLEHASLSDVDLRGAELRRIDGLGYLAGSVISPGQLLELAPFLAAAGGIRVLPEENETQPR